MRVRAPKSHDFGYATIAVALFLYSVTTMAESVWAQAAAMNLTRDVGIEQRLNEQVPLDVDFRDENGKDAKLGDYFGNKPVILALVYHQCPMLCNLSQDGLVSSLRSLSLDAGRDFNVVVVSFDPREGPIDATAKKRIYLKQYGRAGAEQGWHFLTGEQDSIERLTNAVGFRYAYDDKTGQFAHGAGIVVLTPQGRISRYFYGVDYPPRDLRLGLVEASENKIGTLADRVLLLCYDYDPTTGKYGLAIMSALRLGGAATVLTLVTFIVVAIRRERRINSARQINEDVSPTS